MQNLSGKTILFDLDGTLVDPAKGIIAAYQDALGQMGCAVPDHDDLTWVIGPPLRRSFAKMLRTDQDVEQAVAAYRTSYAAGGIFQATVFDGIKNVLEDLRAADCALYVCTAKPTVFARKVISHFGFDPFFLDVYGAELDGRFDDKGDLIAHILSTKGIAAKDTVMIEDRANDTTAAMRNGVSSIGILWGYGDRDELEKSGATQICAAPDDLFGAVSALLTNG